VTKCIFHVDVDTSTLPASALPLFQYICLFHDPFQPLVDDVVEQLVPTIEQHYRSLIRRFVGAASFVELRDGAIHGGPTLARGVIDFSGRVNISLDNCHPDRSLKYVKEESRFSFI